MYNMYDALQLETTILALTCIHTRKSQAQVQGWSIPASHCMCMRINSAHKLPPLSITLVLRQRVTMIVITETLFNAWRSYRTIMESIHCWKAWKVSYLQLQLLLFCHNSANVRFSFISFYIFLDPMYITITESYYHSGQLLVLWKYPSESFIAPHRGSLH